MTNLLLYFIIGVGGIALITLILQLFKIKVWIFVANKRSKKLTRMGFLSPNSHEEVPEVHFPGKTQGPGIGRIKIGDNDDNAYVELLLSDPEDESLKPQYKTYGYVTQEGLIYEQTNKKKKAALIGYTARPSAPDVPTAIGEKTWKTLWLRCTLNAYLGSPKNDTPTEPPAEEDADAKTKSKSKRRTKKVAKRPAAVATYFGIYSSKSDAMPPETRSAAFGLFYDKYNKKKNQEFYSSPAYGWKDTALLAAFVYAIIYCIWYILDVKVLGTRFIGLKFWLDAPAYLLFYAVWCIVRAIKIECIERSDTIQPKIDLFNKIVGQKGFDLAILVCCAVTLAFTGSYYRFNFAPLALAIITGVTINMTLSSSKRPWRVTNPFAQDENPEDSEDSDNIETPAGDIERTYQWELETKKDVKGQLSLYFDAQYIKDLRFMNPFFSQRKDKSTTILVREMFNYVSSHSSVSARSKYVAKKIKDISITSEYGLTELESLQFLLDFVQEPNIRFVMNKDNDSILKYEEYIGFPDEVLYDKAADSNSKAFLAAILVHYFGYNVVFLHSRMQNHGAIGIELNPEWIINDHIFDSKVEDATFHYNNKTYIFCETSPDNFKIGGTLDGMKPDDFDEKVEIPLIPDESEADNEDSKTCLYNWDLDNRRGNELHGTYTLEFNVEDMEELRSHNPFLNYGVDGNSYEDNVKLIFNYLDNDSERKGKVREIATYIKDSITEAGLDEAEMLQFALDFCQMPNIEYKVDEASPGIKYATEYMRFPDEVLFDKQGDCDCKSSLTIALFRELGYKAAFLMSKKYEHAAVGIEYKPVIKDILRIEDDTVVIEKDGTEYLYCETTGDGFRLGQIKEGNTIQDFETIVEIS